MEKCEDEVLRIPDISYIYFEYPLVRVVLCLFYNCQHITRTVGYHLIFSNDRALVCRD